jgi:hypothetical protein
MATQIATPAAPVRTWNTLQLLKACRVAVLALLGVLLAAILWGAKVHHDAMKTIGRDAAPSIIAAQHIKAALADMDADAANILLAPPNTANAATNGFDERRLEASEALIAAAGNVKYDDEREPIKTLGGTMGVYDRIIQEAADFHDAGNAEDVRYYRGSALVMDGTLLAAADDLDRANNKKLDDTYKSDAWRSGAARAFVALAGLAALLALLWTQTFLSRRTRRTLNPMLAVATLMTFGLCWYALGAMGGEEHDLKVATEDAFASIHALWQARAVAYQANAEESRWLLDPAHAEEYQQGFNQEVDALAKLPPGEPGGAGQTIDALISREVAKEHVAGFSGFLADELNNITFDGERAAAAQTLRDFEQYVAIDAQIRQLEHDHKHAEAVQLCLGTNPGQSDWAFAQFDRSLDATLKINQAAFDRAVRDGLDALDGMDIKASIATALTALLAFLGLGRRMREYE